MNGLTEAADRDDVADTTAGGDTKAGGATAAQTCERCGHDMYDRHCKVICPNCGYLRDCSDP